VFHPTHQNPYVVTAQGDVTHPKGQAMIEAARQSLLDACQSQELAAAHFNALMQETGGAPPTPAQLVNLVEACRNGAGI
jgi:hypothetical protein